MHYIYRHYDKSGILLYVGISISHLARLSSHKKNAAWFDKIETIKIEKCESEELSILLEKLAIILEGPVFNKKRPSPEEANKIIKFFMHKELCQKIEERFVAA